MSLFDKPVVLEDSRVLLRPLQSTDLQHLLPFSLNEPGLWQYALVSAAGHENLNTYIISTLTARSQGREYPFIVFDKQSQRYAGCTRYYDIQPGSGTLQLGYTWYGEDFQGTGINQHCKFLLFEHAFNVLNMAHIELRADNSNKRSIQAMKAVGCTVEGVLRSNLPKPGGGRRDSIVLSILKDEWNGGTREWLASKLT